ncbi:hypothetical protein C8Q73DRAFT_51109 [Cubamyces lactineus]|nr:hypothetical protein C8Q73DRAFT_51109 [Cubamyces lactineus]
MRGMQTLKDSVNWVDWGHLYEGNGSLNASCAKDERACLFLLRVLDVLNLESRASPDSRATRKNHPTTCDAIGMHPHCQQRRTRTCRNPPSLSRSLCERHGPLCADVALARRTFVVQHMAWVRRGRAQAHILRQTTASIMHHASSATHAGPNLVVYLPLPLPLPRLPAFASASEGFLLPRAHCAHDTVWRSGYLRLNIEFASARERPAHRHQSQGRSPGALSPGSNGAR